MSLEFADVIDGVLRDGWYVLEHAPLRVVSARGRNLTGCGARTHEFGLHIADRHDHLDELKGAVGILIVFRVWFSSLDGNVDCSSRYLCCIHCVCTQRKEKWGGGIAQLIPSPSR